MKEPKLNFFITKCHDCHMLMMSLLPVAIRNVLHMKVRETVMSLCIFFNAIEQNVIDDELLPFSRQTVIGDTLSDGGLLPSDIF